jgi:hypothetical protein
MYMSDRESSSSHYESYKAGFHQGENQIFLVTILPLAQSRPSKINSIAAAERASGLHFPQAMRRSGKDELCERIQRYIETCNECPPVRKWAYGIHRDQELLAA